VGDLALSATGADPQLHDRDADTERTLRRAAQPHARRAKLEVWPMWLGEDPADTAQLEALLVPYPSDHMISWPVSTRIGNVKNNDPSLIVSIVLP
jgi:putative SOS response-associated peptidase YedK